MNCLVREYSVFRELRQEQQFPAAGAQNKNLCENGQKRKSAWHKRIF